MVSTKGDEIPGSFSNQAGAMYGVDPGVQDERSRVKPTEVVDDGVSAHMFDRRAGKVWHLAHETANRPLRWTGRESRPHSF